MLMQRFRLPSDIKAAGYPVPHNSSVDEWEASEDFHIALCERNAVEGG